MYVHGSEVIYMRMRKRTNACIPRRRHKRVSSSLYLASHTDNFRWYEKKHRLLSISTYENRKVLIISRDPLSMLSLRPGMYLLLFFFSNDSEDFSIEYKKSKHSRNKIYVEIETSREFTKMPVFKIHLVAYRCILFIPIHTYTRTHHSSLFFSKYLSRNIIRCDSCELHRTKRLPSARVQQTIF